jgi:hypothetical protein
MVRLDDTAIERQIDGGAECVFDFDHVTTIVVAQGLYAKYGCWKAFAPERCRGELF